MSASAEFRRERRRVPVAACTYRAARLLRAVGNLVEEKGYFVLCDLARNLYDVLGVSLLASHGAEVVACQRDFRDLAVLPHVERPPCKALQFYRLAREGVVDDVVYHRRAHTVLE